MRARFVVRIRLISALFVVGAAILIGRLYLVQVVKGDEYHEAALGQYVATSDRLDRGAILFTRRDGEEVAAAVMQGGWRIAINPSKLVDVDTALAQLKSVVSIDEKRFRASAAKKDDPYEEVAYRLNDDQAAAIRNMRINGVLTVRDEWRFYPGKELAAQTIGFVGYRGEKREGVYGLERYYEDTLRHESGGLYINPFAEIFSNVGAFLSNDPALMQGSIITSLEPSVQRYLEDRLLEVMREHTPKFAGGIIMDPKTGEIVALGVLPSFDINAYNVVENPARFSNQLVESAYELGSIMKPLTVAAAIDVGAVTPGTTYNDKGCIVKSGARICNFDKKGRGVVDMQEVLSQSLNTGVSFVVDRMGNERFVEYVQKLKLAEETGIDLPNESHGSINSILAEGAADVDFASASFGQSIAMTPLSMVRALSALGNGGVLPEPHLVRAIRYDSGVVRSLEYGEGERVFSPETAETISSMLVKVYDTALLEGTLKQEHYSIAAKTGTAQIAIPGGGGYYPDRYLHSFFGYFPAHDARFIVLLVALEPVGEMYASRTLARPFSDIAKFLINYYTIPPDR